MSQLSDDECQVVLRRGCGLWTRSSKNHLRCLSNKRANTTPCLYHPTILLVKNRHKVRTIFTLDDYLATLREVWPSPHRWSSIYFWQFPWSDLKTILCRRILQRCLTAAIVCWIEVVRRIGMWVNLVFKYP